MLSTLRSSHGLQRFMLLLGVGLIVAFLLLAIFAPWIAPYDFNADRVGTEVFGRQQPPSADHWFGTTVGGTDVLSRVVYGARTAVIVIVLAVVLSGIVGVPLGLVSGYLGGSVDRALVLVMDPLDLVDRALERPVGLHVHGLPKAVRRDVGDVLLGRVVAVLQRLVRTEDARDHRAGQPRQLLVRPDVVVGVDVAAHSRFTCSSNEGMSRAPASSTSG